MANQLYRQMTQNQSLQNNLTPQLQSIKQLANMLKGQSNPMQALQMLAGQNPQIGQVLNMLNGSGMTPKNLFMQYAQQMGIDPNQIINLLKGM